jgi:hypothetical protein
MMNLQWVAGVFALSCFAAPPAVLAKKGVSPFTPSVEVTTPAPLVLWKSPQDIESRDLFWGAGGKQHEPQGPFTFDKENLHGTSPKITVKDREGVTWGVKMGMEARPETAASRLLWAVGYHTDQDYFLPRVQIVNLPGHLRRGQQYASAGGFLSNVMFERHRRDEKQEGEWKWRSNPFSGTREFNGLRVMMALLNNWDLKDSNNTIYVLTDPESTSGSVRVYVVADLGASFGTNGIVLPYSHAKGNLSSYSHSKFIHKVASDYVDFNVPAAPQPIFAFNTFNFFHPFEYFGRLQQRWIGRHIPRSDAKWLGDLLARLSPGQIRDAFRAAGYSPQEIDAFTEIVRNRIAALEDL